MTTSTGMIKKHLNNALLKQDLSGFDPVEYFA